MKRTLVYNMRAETSRQNLSQINLSRGYVCGVTQIFRHSTHVPK